MISGKKGWIAAIAIGVVFGLFKHESSTSAGEMINEGRVLSPQEQKFAVMGKGFTPMKAPCSLSRSGHEADDECKDWNGISYSFSTDHKRLWQIKREEKLPDNVSFADLISQVSRTYGPPASTSISCQAVWGNTSGVQGIWYEIVAPAEDCNQMLSTKGLKVQYVLLDNSEYANVAKADRQREESERSESVASHRF